MDFQEFIKFPFQDREWLKKFIIGCIISVIPLVNLIVLGYFMECLQMGINGRRALPEWDRWGDYGKNGFMALIISLAYLLIPIILAPILMLIPGPGVFLASIITLIMGLMIPMALANYIVSRNFGDAFNFSKILYQINELVKLYLPAYLLMALSTAIGGAIILGIPFLAFLGVILVFYCGVLFFYLLGQLFHDSMIN